MRFEARELKRYAEPVSPSNLRELEVYFTVQYCDESLLIPIVEPLVFIGRNLTDGDTDYYYFQDYESYRAGIRYQSANDEDKSDFHIRGPKDLRHIFDYEHALEELLKCSIRRRAGDSARSS